MHEKPMGQVVRFLLPSLKLKQSVEGDQTMEGRVHAFLMQQFGGYTAASGNIFGYWRDSSGSESYGEHREFTVAVADSSKLPVLKEFIAQLAAQLEEESIYVETGGEGALIYAAKEKSN